MTLHVNKKMNLFGRMRKTQSPPPVDPNRSIAVLSDAIDTLQKREKHLQKQSANALAQARDKSKAKDKRGKGVGEPGSKVLTSGRGIFSALGRTVSQTRNAQYWIES